MYAKIYCGPEMMERILIEEITTIVQQFSAQDLIDNFFFVRFSDHDGDHLRLRFHLTKCAHVGLVIETLTDKLAYLISTGLIAKVNYDTYNRELERYGHESILDIETLFGASSWLILYHLKKDSDNDKPDNRWVWGAKIMDVLLKELGITEKERYSICESYYQAYTREFGVSKETKELLSKKYREFAKEIEGMLVSDDLNNTMLYQVPYFLNGQMETAIRNLTEKYRGEEKNELQENLQILLFGLMHMHYNKLFISQQRASEFVMYSILSKLYKSRMIRSGEKKTVHVSMVNDRKQIV